MNRKELAVLRDAIDAVLTWPDAVRDQVARWIGAPEAAKPNGADPHPPPRQSLLLGKDPRRSPTAHAGKERRGKPASAKAEQRLLAALQEHSGASVNVLAKAAGANRSSTGERLRGLAARGVVTKDAGGHWRLVGDLLKSEEILAGEEARPPGASPS
jgi:hypothetical protein